MMEHRGYAGRTETAQAENLRGGPQLPATIEDIGLAYTREYTGTRGTDTGTLSGRTDRPGRTTPAKP
jgi:hypothetical protein